MPKMHITKLIGIDSTSNEKWQVFAFLTQGLQAITLSQYSELESVGDWSSTDSEDDQDYQQNLEQEQLSSQAPESTDTDDDDSELRHRRTRIVLKSESESESRKEYFSVWRVIVRDVRADSRVGAECAAATASLTHSRSWAVLMCSAGYFAGAVYKVCDLCVCVPPAFFRTV